ncbi:uncharacterized protein LOC116342199 [Contarinia nasturtii]|nr:uncharacterized protein LOC116342199 [Contarinia nasturtii]
MIFGNSIDKYKVLPNLRLRKHLGSSKGSRRGNTGNHLELQVLTQIQHVP